MYRKLTFLILFGALVLRLAAGLWWQQRLPDGQPFGFPDSTAYWELSRKVASGQPFAMNADRRVFRTPGYPLLLSGLFLAADGSPPVAWARVLNACLGTLAVLGVMVLASLLFDGRTSLVAGAIAAVYPSAISMSTFVLTEAPFCPFMLLHLALWVLAWRAPTRRRQLGWAIAGGLTAGVATLIRPSWLLFTPFSLAIGVALALLFRSRTASQSADPTGGVCMPSADSSGERISRVGPVLLTRHFWIGIGMMGGLIVAMSPWWVRNWQVTGHFVPTTLQVGESLYDGLNPTATGASNMEFVDRFRQELLESDSLGASPKLGVDSFEQRLDDRMKHAASRWAVAHPKRVLELAAIKFVRMWNVWPNEASLRNPVMGLALCCAYLPVLLLAIYGGWRFLRRGWPYVLCFLPAVYFTCLHVVFVGSIRYRQPAMLPLITIAAGALLAVLAKPPEKEIPSD